MSGRSKITDGTGRLTLVRHTQVETRFSGVCYGVSDIELSTDGKTHAHELAVTLAAKQPTLVIHSGLSRARFLAEKIAGHAGLQATSDTRLQEINFGTWELRRWDDIFADVGHAMSKIIHEPDMFAAPGGETAHQVRDRMMAWANELPHDQNIIAISHGGAISALHGTLTGVASSTWPGLMPKFGQHIRIQLPVSPK